MGIRLHPKENPTSYRIYRAWGGKEYQRYVPLSSSRNRAYKKAVEIDTTLKVSQDAYKLRMSLALNSLFNADGTVIGLSKTVCDREGRQSTDIFKLRIKIPTKQKVHHTSISISHHGLDKAYLLIVGKICEWRGIKHNSNEYKNLLNGKAHYRT